VELRLQVVSRPLYQRGPYLLLLQVGVVHTQTSRVDTATSQVHAESLVVVLVLTPLLFPPLVAGPILYCCCCGPGKAQVS
jgi:hypothetical protein